MDEVGKGDEGECRGMKRERSERERERNSKSERREGSATVVAGIDYVIDWNRLTECIIQLSISRRELLSNVSFPVPNRFF